MFKALLSGRFVYIIAKVLFNTRITVILSLENRVNYKI